MTANESVSAARMAMVEEFSVNHRKWEIEDAPDLAAAIKNIKVLDNLRDGTGG